MAGFAPRRWLDLLRQGGWICPEYGARTVKRHIANILTYYQHPITNAMSEGLNSKIQKIKSMACGFRNMENFKTSIYFHCGGLDLYPC